MGVEDMQMPVLARPEGRECSRIPPSRVSFPKQGPCQQRYLPAPTSCACFSMCGEAGGKPGPGCGVVVGGAFSVTPLTCLSWLTIQMALSPASPCWCQSSRGGGVAQAPPNRAYSGLRGWGQPHEVGVLLLPAPKHCPVWLK